MGAEELVAPPVLPQEVLMTSLSASPGSPSPNDQPTLPLWRRTQQRLARMETWSAQHRNTSDGFDERIQLQDERIALACRHLVLLLKEHEDRQN